MKVSIDTRTLQPGDTFIPVKGPHFDGHDFIDEAIRKGARQILDVDLAAYAKRYRKKLSAKVIGITGSFGKTTAKDMLSAVLSQRYNVVKTTQNQNTPLGSRYPAQSGCGYGHHCGRNGDAATRGHWDPGQNSPAKLWGDHRYRPVTCRIFQKCCGDCQRESPTVSVTIALGEDASGRVYKQRDPACRPGPNHCRKERVFDSAFFWERRA